MYPVPFIVLKEINKWVCVCVCTHMFWQEFSIFVLNCPILSKYIIKLMYHCKRGNTHNLIIGHRTYKIKSCSCICLTFTHTSFGLYVLCLPHSAGKIFNFQQQQHQLLLCASWHRKRFTSGTLGIAWSGMAEVDTLDYLATLCRTGKREANFNHLSWQEVIPYKYIIVICLLYFIFGICICKVGKGLKKGEE